MRSISAFAFIGFLGVILAAPAAAQREVARPALTPAPGGPALLTDVSTSFDQTEKNIEQQYAKLIQETKGKIESLNDQIKDLDRQIQALKEQAKKLALVQQKLEELLPKILGAVGSDSAAGFGRTPSTKSSQLAAQLKAELAKVGISLSAGELEAIADAIGKGGAAAVRDQTAGRLASIQKAIDTLAAQIKATTDQIAALAREIEKLEADKAKAIADLRKQKEKAIADAKARDSRLLRLPTPTPARKP